MAVNKEYKIKQVIRVLITPEGSFLGVYDLYRELGIKEDFTPWIEQMFKVCNIEKRHRPVMSEHSILYERRGQPDYQITFETARLLIEKCTAPEENKRAILKCFQENELNYIKRFQYPQRLSASESTELIRITERNGQRAVSARELHRFLEVGRDFSSWIKERIEKYKFTKNEDYQVFPNFGENPKGGRPTIEYALSLDMAKELSMVENNEKGKQARRYFIEVEKKYHLRAGQEVEKFTLKEFSLVNTFCGVFYHKAGAILKLNFTTTDVTFKTLVVPIITICGGIAHKSLCGYLFREPEGALSAQKKLTALCYSFEIPLVSMNTICEFGLKEAGMLETYKKFYNT